jgi:DNA-binding MarR family transcriptional regulator
MLGGSVGRAIIAQSGGPPHRVPAVPLDGNIVVVYKYRMDAHLSGESRRLAALLRALARRFAVSERADVACCGMTVAQAAALEALHADGPLRLGDLGRRLGVAPSTLSRNLDRLVTRGFVTRSADPRDSRAAAATLTAAGRRAAARVANQDETFAKSVLELLPAGRRADAVDSLAALLGAVRAATERCCPGAFDHLMQDFPTQPVPIITRPARVRRNQR